MPKDNNNHYKASEFYERSSERDRAIQALQNMKKLEARFAKKLKTVQIGKTIISALPQSIDSIIKNIQ